jgi:hypothetical protein
MHGYITTKPAKRTSLDETASFDVQYPGVDKPTSHVCEPEKEKKVKGKDAVADSFTFVEGRGSLTGHCQL